MPSIHTLLHGAEAEACSRLVTYLFIIASDAGGK